MSVLARVSIATFRTIGADEEARASRAQRKIFLYNDSYPMGFLLKDEDDTTEIKTWEELTDPNRAASHGVENTKDAPCIDFHPLP